MIAPVPPYRTARLPNADIAYLDFGEGDPVLLIHGFASSAAINWAETGWLAALAGAGRRGVALDNRGHGRSTKFHRPADYALPLMAGDALALLDDLGIEKADLVGYSMGGKIAAALALAAPARVRSLTIAGAGIALIAGTRGAETIAEALEQEGGLAGVADPMGRMFRRFADRPGNDLAALAACMRARREGIAAGRLAGLAMPVLVVVGTDDDVAGPPGPLMTAMPRASLLLLPGRDHMRAVGDAGFRRGVLEFLARRP